MNKQCVNRPGATDHTTAECPMMVEASAVVNQQVTTAAVAPDALEQARRHLSNAIEDAEDGKTAAALPALREVAHYLAHAAAPTVKAEQVDDLSAEVESMVRALEEGEWAEHAGQTEIGARLESAITTLINRLPAPSLPAAVSADLTRVKCPCCPYEYDADSYDAGFIAGRGMCQVCDAAMPPKDLPAAGSADVGKFSVQCGVCKESSTLDDRKELSGCCWACGHEIDLDSQLRAALSAQQSTPLTITRDQIRDVFMRNGFTVKEGQTDLKPYVYAAAQELLALANAQQSAHVSVPRELLRRVCREDGASNDMAMEELRAILNGGDA